MVTGKHSKAYSCPAVTRQVERSPVHQAWNSVCLAWPEGKHFASLERDGGVSLSSALSNRVALLCAVKAGHLTPAFTPRKFESHFDLVDFS